MSHAKQLYQLQQVDSELDRAKLRLDEISKTLGNNSVVKNANAKAERATKLLTEAQLALRKAETEVAGQQDKIEKNHKALYGGAVKNPKELEDLQMESEALARYLTTLEDKQLEAMVRQEEREEAMGEAQENLDRVLQEVAAQNKDLTVEQSGLKESVERLKKERDEQAAEIPTDELKIYENLRKSRRGLAVTEVIDNSCAVCGATLTAALTQAARSPTMLAYCSGCGRLLHMP